MWFGNFGSGVVNKIFDGGLEISIIVFSFVKKYLNMELLKLASAMAILLFAIYTTVKVWKDTSIGGKIISSLCIGLAGVLITVRIITLLTT